MPAATPATVVAVFGITPHRIGGVEIYTRELARQLEARGARLVAVFNKRPSGVVAEYLTAPNLILEEIDDLENRPWGSVPELMALLRRYRPRIVHFQFVNFVGLFPWAAKLCGARQIFFTAQGSEPTGFVPRRSAWWKRMLVRIINAPVDRVFCISDYVKRMLTARDLLPESRFRVVFNAIVPPELSNAAAQRATFRERFGISPDSLLVTQVSWIIPEKGIPQLLDAAKKVLREIPDARFAIVGAGAGEAGFRERAKELGIADSLVWTGSIMNPMEEGVYAAADVFCLASQWQEAFGWVIAEAMAFEVPVVATKVGGIPEVVEENVTGLLADPCTDTDLLARHILTLLRDAQTRRKMGVAGRQAVERKFHIHRTVAEVVSEYKL